MSQSESRQALGTGILGWDRQERITDRYGSVFLMDGVVTETANINTDNIDQYLGKKGTLIATVENGSESGHIGDIFHGLGQDEIPSKGEQFELGTGKLFSLSTDEYDDHIRLRIGIEPDEDTETFWMDAEALYQVHDSLVTLSFTAEDS